MAKRTFQFADASDLLNIPPTRARETTYRERVKLSREYINLVLRPARFVALLWVFSGAAIIGGSAYVASEVLRNPQPRGVIFSAVIIGAGFGGIVAVAHFWRLHLGYAETPGGIEETMREHELDAATTGRRVIGVNGAGGRVEQVVLSPRSLGPLTFSPSQIDGMQRRAEEDGRLTRDTGGWSGTQYNAVREELGRRKFIDIDASGCTWTPAGLEWLNG